ncbi:ArpU family phage packaging/lysis transcriptional regulator [Pediococcus argentinicus]|uniref:ArpU family phage packaging/lysis transcriptional regulator n=1 Tax=Pediococcus argentinicus TaxID=480391 RepID=UPI00338E4C62
MERVEEAAVNKLKKCRSLMRLARMRLSDLKSPTISDMPSSPAYGNAIEDKVISQANAQAELKEIYQAISWLKKDEQQLLFAKFMDPEEPTDIMIYLDMGLDERTFYRLQSKALMEFAESYRYGSLFVNS